MTTLLFERFNVPALFIAKDAVLAAFSAGKPSALVVDIGGGTTKVTPVWDGYALTQASVHSTLAGDRLDVELARRIAARGGADAVCVLPRYAALAQRQRRAAGTDLTFPATATAAQVARAIGVTDAFHAAAAADLWREARATTCRVSDEPLSSSGGGANGSSAALSSMEADANLPAATFELPDGNILDVGRDRFAVPELLFEPATLRGEGNARYEGLAAMMTRAVDATDVDVRRDLYATIVVCGGCALTPNLVKRVERDVQARLASTAYKPKTVTASRLSDRSFAPWLGGSIFASLGTFQQLWISRAEFNEYGASVVHKKCP